MKLVLLILIIDGTESILSKFERIRWILKHTVWLKILTGGNIDKYDEIPAIRQYFLYQNFYLAT